MPSATPSTRSTDAEPAEENLAEDNRLVPAGPRTTTGSDGPKRSFWRRISLRRSREKEPAGEEDSPPTWSPGEPLAGRLAVLERRIGAEADAIRSQLERIDGRFDEVWEVEEQISHLIEIQQKLEVLSQDQEQLATRVANASVRNTILVSLAIGAALLAAVFAAGI